MSTPPPPPVPGLTVMIDNFDSFTYNIVQYLQELGADVRVYRNDAITLAELEALRPSRLVLSPGPGAPCDAGITSDVLRAWAGRVPILGVCLGLQCMYEAYGGTVTHAGEIVHGKSSPIEHDGRGVFAGLPSPFKAVRYHSLAGTRATLPRDLLVTATSPGGVIQGVRHRLYAVEGVQFHPESILTEHGHAMFRNFLSWKGGLWEAEAQAQAPAQQHPLAILSTLPAATAAVYALGLQGQLRSVSHECIFPPPARRLPRILTAAIDSDALSSAAIDAAVKAATAAGTPLYTLDQAALQRVDASCGRLVVLTQNLCDVCAPGPQLMAAACAALPPSPSRTLLDCSGASLAGMLADVQGIADACGVGEVGRGLVAALQARVAAVQASVAGKAGVSVACVEWLAPLYNSGHWVPELVRLAGGTEAWGKAGEFSTGLPNDALSACNPDVILLMPCGFDVARTLREGKEVLPAAIPGWSALRAVAGGRVWAVHGNRLFSGASPALVEGLELLAVLLHGSAAQQEALAPEDAVRFTV